MHEISHSLGFSSSKFAKFRDAAGSVRSNVISTFSQAGKKVSKMTTPAVRARALVHKQLLWGQDLPSCTAVEECAASSKGGHRQPVSR